MSEKIRIFITSLLAILCLALCVCCFTACGEDKDECIAELEAVIREKEQLIAELQAENAEYAEQVAELNNLYKILSIRWDDMHQEGEFIVQIKEEYASEAYSAEDLLPSVAAEARAIDDIFYVITLEDRGTSAMFDAALQLYSNEIVERVDLNYILVGV